MDCERELVTILGVSNKLRNQPKARKPKPEPIKTRRSFHPVRAAVTILGVIASVIALLALLPRPLVTPSDPVDPNNVFSAAFTIANTNFVPLDDVNVLLGVGEIVPSGASPALRPTPGFIPDFTSRLAFGAWQHHVLEMDDRYTVSLADSFDFGKTGPRWADIAIIVSYKPWILPFHREKAFRFITRKQTNGQLYWFRCPLTRLRLSPICQTSTPLDELFQG